MKVKMTQTIKGAADPSGTRAKIYEAGKEYDVHEELAQVFLREGWAKKNKEQKAAEETKDLKASEENKEEAPAETKVEEPEVKEEPPKPEEKKEATSNKKDEKKK